MSLSRWEREYLRLLEAQIRAAEQAAEASRLALARFRGFDGRVVE